MFNWPAMHLFSFKVTVTADRLISCLFGGVWNGYYCPPAYCTCVPFSGQTFGVVWCGVVRYGVLWCGVVWCGVMYAVVWCGEGGVVWCGVV